MIDPSERLEQLCDYTALTQIRNDDKSFRPTAPWPMPWRTEGQAGHHRDQRRRIPQPRQMVYFDYRCQATPDHMSVVAFNYSIGPEIPETKWAAFGLWD